jgi:hypothetical protein
MAPVNATAQRVRVFNVPLGNDLCDVTAQWILQTSGQDPLTVSSTILLLPNNRAIKAMTEAFVRQAAPGLLLPRMVAVGDMQLDEALGPLLDPISSEDVIWPVIGSFDRLMLLARLAQEHGPQGTFLSRCAWRANWPSSLMSLRLIWSISMHCQTSKLRLTSPGIGNVLMVSF